MSPKKLTLSQKIAQKGYQQERYRLKKLFPWMFDDNHVKWLNALEAKYNPESLNIECDHPEVDYIEDGMYESNYCSDNRLLCRTCKTLITEQELENAMYYGLEIAVFCGGNPSNSVAYKKVSQEKIQL